MSQRVFWWRVPLLWTLLGLFMLRVLGQVYVGLYSPEWLPPWSEWYSGLLPYPLLLPVQILLLMWLAVVTCDNSRCIGTFWVETNVVKHRLRWLAAVYAGVMLLRYVLTMALEPEMRWFHGTIPIAFHWVLAAYIVTLTVRATDKSRRRVNGVRAAENMGTDLSSAQAGSNK